MDSFNSGFGSSDFMFQVFPIIFSIIFILVIGIFIFSIVKGVSQWNKNNHSPVLTVEATVVAKRTDVTHHNHNSGNTNMNHTSSSTWYYVTFQVESGDRMELALSDSDYGMIAEGDAGKLTFQGTRFQGFERKK